MNGDDKSLLSDSEFQEISDAIDDEIQYIQKYWEELNFDDNEDIQHLAMMLKEAFRPSVPSRIPGHKVVSPMRPQVCSMIALVTDMRNSTEHLLNDYKQFSGPGKRLFRVHVETGALIAATATLVQLRGGDTPEFLGDGCLSFFDYDIQNQSQRVKQAYSCGLAVVDAVRTLVNPKLSLIGIPNIEIGVGIAASKSIITVVGVQGNYLPKVIGECVYRASKCSRGINAVAMDISAKGIYPKSKGGKRKFAKYRTNLGKYRSTVYMEKSKGFLPLKWYLEDKS